MRFAILLDSPEGIKLLMDWATDHGFVLNEWHEATARKWNVPIPDGLVVSRPLPTLPAKL